MHKIKIIAGMIILVCLLGGAIIFRQMAADRKPENLADLGPAIGIQFPNGAEFKLVKNVLRPGGAMSLRSVEANHDSRLLKLEIITGLNLSQARQAMNERLNMIEALFSNLPTPYPGLVTNTVTVPEEIRPRKLPIKVADQEQSIYLLAASSRKTYGVMAADQVAYRAGVLFLYLESGSVFCRLDYLIPAAEYSEAEMVNFFSGLSLTSLPVNLTPADSTQEDSGRQTTNPTPKPSPVQDTEPEIQTWNLILIAFEPLGANHVGAYGYSKATTPNLDSFARESFLFENAVSTSSWTLPAFMSWFTSLYPDQHRVINKFSRFSAREEVLASLPDLAPGTLTLTQVLQEHGYRTAAFTGGASLAKEFGFGLGFEKYGDQPRFAGFDRTMPQALDWLTGHQREKFFLFVQGYDVHGQFPLDRKNMGRFLDPPYRGELTGSEEEYWKLRDRNLETGEVKIPADDLRLLRAVYDTKIYDADQRFGLFIEKLRELGLLDNSIVVVSSGSGNEYLEHGRIDHGYSLYEELIHVPLLIRIPGKKGRIPDLVRTLDLMPTILNLLNIAPEPAVQEQMRGVSLVPLLSGKHLRLDAVSETDYLQRSFKRSLKTSDGWKFILSLDTEERELYNLNDDPAEQHNLARQNPRLAYELEQRMYAILRGETPAGATVK